MAYIKPNNVRNGSGGRYVSFKKPHLFVINGLWRYHFAGFVSSFLPEIQENIRKSYAHCIKLNEAKNDTN